MKPIRRRTLSNQGAVKRAVSLPRALDEVVLAVSKENHRTYSSIVRDALDLYVGQLKETELEKSYRAYYSRGEERQAGQKLADELFPLSKQGWPD